LGRMPRIWKPISISIFIVAPMMPLKVMCKKEEITLVG